MRWEGRGNTQSNKYHEKYLRREESERESKKSTSNGMHSPTFVVSYFWFFCCGNIIALLRLFWLFFVRLFCCLSYRSITTQPISRFKCSILVRRGLCRLTTAAFVIHSNFAFRCSTIAYMFLCTITCGNVLVHWAILCGCINEKRAALMTSGIL